MKSTGTLILGIAALVLIGLLSRVAPDARSVESAGTTAVVTPISATGQQAEPSPTDEAGEGVPEVTQDVTQGALRFKADGGLVECPLKHTDVQAAISGFVSRVTVKQTFQNPADEPIEATYVFPLPHESAVDRMTMLIGDRRIEGRIERRDDARRIYEAALMAGQTAALLEQERPNIFTQSVGNIPPGETVEIEISYVDVLRYDMGEYTFHFPMVVGPRYIPGSPISSPQPRPDELQGRVSPPDVDTDRVPDASRINPPVLRPEYRTGHDISLTVHLDAGVPVQGLQVINHEVSTEHESTSEATVQIKPSDSLPNKDFVLRYRVLGQKPEMALLAHTGSYSRDSTRLGEGYFMLMVQPREDERLTSHPPREMVFLVDVSGSMRGEPTAKVIDAMREMLKLCRPQDTVQVVTFAGSAHALFPQPVPVIPENVNRALNFTSQLQGSGGTEMLRGVQMAIDQPLDEERMRIVVMLTDGYIGNEAEIIEHVGENCGDRIRFWAIGIGQSPNMFLIDGVARQGGGMGKHLTLQDNHVALTTEIMSRIQRAQLGDVSIDWGDLDIAETYPARIPELWAGRPILVVGRYRQPGTATIQIRGQVEGEAVSWPLEVSLPGEQAEHDVLANVWARRKIEDLMHQAYYGESPAIEEAVTALALDYALMSPYTSFVAVDSSQPVEPQARPPRHMPVPVPLPDGTDWQGFFGGGSAFFGDDAAEGDAAWWGQQQAQFGGEWAARLGDRSGAIGGGGVVAFSRQLTAGTPVSGFGMAPARGGRGGGGALPATASFRGTVRGRQAAPAAPALQLRRLSLAQNQPSGLGSSGGDSRRFLYLLRDEDGATAVQEPQAVEELEAAKVARESGEIEEARRLLVQAILLERAAIGAGQSNGQTLLEAERLLSELHQQRMETWIEEHPALSSRLDLVLRDTTVADAIAELARHSGLTITLEPGSLEDVARLQAKYSLRIDYLDLRHATVAEALEWLAAPRSLTWSVSPEGEVTVQSERRGPGTTAWIYDVSLLVNPTREELQETPTTEAFVERVIAEQRQFLEDVAGTFDEARIQWFAPGQILVIGSADEHRGVASLLERLATAEDVPVRWESQAETLRRRYAANLEAWEELEANWEIAVTRARHARYAWQLLASAAAGVVDDEAATQLAIAWNDEDTTALLGEEMRMEVCRSLWVVIRAAEMLPREDRLQELARTARNRAEGHERDGQTDSTITAAAYLAEWYYASTMSPGEMPTVPELGQDAEPALRLAVLVTQRLQNPDEPWNAAEAVGIAADAANSDDLVLLTALACAQTGDQAWNQFRVSVLSRLGQRPIAGSIVVLLHRLDGSLLARL